MRTDLYDAKRYMPDDLRFMLTRAAQLAHEANRAYCESIGDFSQPSWADAPEWQRASAISGAWFHFNNPQASASDSHDNWYAEKQRDGWSYGPVKDPDRKQHPCFVPYYQLPVEQRIKDHIFRSVIHACIEVTVS